MRTRRNTFTAVSLTLAALLAIGGCSTAVGSQDVPSESDGKGTSQPKPTSPNDVKVTDPEEVTAPTDDATEGPTILEMEDYWGIVPEDIDVPEDIKAAFPENYDTVVRYALAEQFEGSTLRDFQRKPTAEAEASRDLYAMSLDGYLSDTLKEKYQAAFKDVNSENYPLLFALSPISSPDGTFTMADGTVLEVDDTRFWNLGVNNVQVASLGVSETDGTQGVLVTLDRAVYIPIANQSYDIALTNTINLLLIPGVDKAWQIDGVSWSDSRLDKLERE